MLRNSEEKNKRDPDGGAESKSGKVRGGWGEKGKVQLVVQLVVVLILGWSASRCCHWAMRGTTKGKGSALQQPRGPSRGTDRTDTDTDTRPPTVTTGLVWLGGWEVERRWLGGCDGRRVGGCEDGRAGPGRVCVR